MPVLGIVENMSYFVGDDGKRYEIFRHGGGKKLAPRSRRAVPGRDADRRRVAECGDAGEPIVAADPDSEAARAFLAVARATAAQLSKRAVEGAGQRPTIKFV